VVQTAHRRHVRGSGASDGNLGIAQEATSGTTHDQRTQPAPLLDVFRERCWARALLVREGLFDLQEAVDTLQAAAVAYGLVAESGQGHVQQIMADAFRPRQEPC
jgi:hypothetical protein